MLTRKPILLSTTCGSLSSLSAAQAKSSTSSPRWNAGTRQQQCPRSTSRKYATVSGGGEEGSAFGGHEWPMPPKGHKCPTPYQIFALKKNEAYSKTRFYQLVKLYHPDKNGHSSDSMSHEMRTERYRLVVAANSILSDPAKRSAYDRLGSGWDGRADAAERGSNAGGPFNQNWRNPSDPVWQNATWEDWERWRERCEDEAMGVRREKQSPLYMQNSYFIMLIAFLALMGSSANYSRAQDAGQSFVEQRDIVHDRAAKELRKVKQDVQGMRGRDERIQWFLRNREATMGISSDDVETMRQEKADRLLPNREVCRSEDIVESDT
ncbi:hypothetical protein WHR41_04338 [Cladosporium halotolerans]|uniref:J domain-containing protein n=1 Tax=Cladosporium halotolerans TaxID=1052096 RepID=A0AB34KQD6_9PEZI